MEDPLPHHWALTSTEDREIRAFVSSTFEDMKGEREHLLKKVFPEIRRICAERGFTFTEIDLRWGITERQARKKKIVSTCLDEVHRHKPYVIGIIGERYGWQPTPEDLGTDATVHERYPWLRDAVEARRSLVELETLESALHDPSMRNRVRFYIRGPVSPERNGHTPNAEEIERVQELKERIRSRGLPIRDGYPDVQTLGEWVREDLLHYIDHRATITPGSSYVEDERRGHEAFALSRRRVYVPHQPTIDRLTEHASWFSDEPPVWEREIDIDAPLTFGPPAAEALPLVITGDSGAGKSSLIAYWSDHFRSEHPETFVVTHHVGATATSANHLGLMRRVMMEIKERFTVSAEVPTDPEKIVNDFRYWLGYASREGMVLVIDALNQLNESSRSSLGWLPDYFPPYVRVIVSTIGGDVLDELQRRNWHMLRVRPLNRKTRQTVVREYFRSFGKTLDAQNVRRLVADEKTHSPFYLVTTMEELRVFSTHEEISQRIDHYLKARDLDDLFQRVLARLEDDYGKNLVRDVTCLIWVSRNGLSEKELLDLTGLPEESLSVFLHAMGYHLLSRDGLIGFSHDYLRQAVQRRYLTIASRRRREEETLANA